MTANHPSTKGLVYTALFGALTAAGAFIVIPLPPVPITAQTFFLNVAAVLLGARLGAMSQLIYVLLGVIGIPVLPEARRVWECSSDRPAGICWALFLPRLLSA